jgi:hypothetical protein
MSMSENRTTEIRRSQGPSVGFLFCWFLFYISSLSIRKPVADATAAKWSVAIEDSKLDIWGIFF